MMSHIYAVAIVVDLGLLAMRRGRATSNRKGLIVAFHAWRGLLSQSINEALVSQVYVSGVRLEQWVA